MCSASQRPERVRRAEEKEKNISHVAPALVALNWTFPVCTLSQCCKTRTLQRGTVFHGRRKENSNADSLAFNFMISALSHFTLALKYSFNIVTSPPLIFFMPPHSFWACFRGRLCRMHTRNISRPVISDEQQSAARRMSFTTSTAQMIYSSPPLKSD